MFTQSKVSLITFGVRGFSAYGENSVKYGYANADDFFVKYHWWSHPEDSLIYHVDPSDCQGAVVIDINYALERNYELAKAMVINGPLVSVSLGENEIHRIGLPKDNVMVNALAKDKNNIFGDLIRLHQASKSDIGPLDSVGVGLYKVMWKSCGARVGYVKDDKIIWEE